MYSQFWTTLIINVIQFCDKVVNVSNNMLMFLTKCLCHEKACSHRYTAFVSKY